MNELKLYTDSSVNNKSKIGYGAYLLISKHGFSIDSLKSDVKIKRFEETTSTKLELQTLLWALHKINPSTNKIIIYTDSQNIIGLNDRRERLEQNNYSSKKNELIKNHLLYQEFYKITDKLNCKLIKVVGHKKSAQKSDIDWLFTLVDRASRGALRKEYSAKNKKHAYEIIY